MKSITVQSSLHSPLLSSAVREYAVPRAINGCGKPNRCGEQVAAMKRRMASVRSLAPPFTLGRREELSLPKPGAAPMLLFPPAFGAVVSTRGEGPAYEDLGRDKSEIARPGISNARRQGFRQGSIPDGRTWCGVVCGTG